MPSWTTSESTIPHLQRTRQRQCTSSTRQSPQHLVAGQAHLLLPWGRLPPPPPLRSLGRDFVRQNGLQTARPTTWHTLFARVRPDLQWMALSHRALPLRPATRIAPPHSPGATRPALLPSATSHVTARTRTSLTSSRAPCHDVCSSLSRPALRRRATFTLLCRNITYHGQDSDLIGQPRAPCMMSASASLTLHGELRLQPERIFHPARHLLPATSRVAARTRHCPVPAHQLMMSAQSHETQRAAPDLHCRVEHNPQ